MWRRIIGNDVGQEEYDGAAVAKYGSVCLSLWKCEWKLLVQDWSRIDHSPLFCVQVAPPPAICQTIDSWTKPEDLLQLLPNSIRCQNIEDSASILGTERQTQAYWEPNGQKLLNSHAESAHVVISSGFMNCSVVTSPADPKSPASSYCAFVWDGVDGNCTTNADNLGVLCVWLLLIWRAVQFTVRQSRHHRPNAHADSSQFYSQLL